MAGVLEGGEHDGGLALGGDLGLEVLGDREQELLGAAARALVGGDGVERAAGGGRRRPRGRARRVDGASAAGQRAGAAEEPALAVAGAEGAGDLELLGRLDALGEQDGAGALGLGVDGVDDRGDRGRGVLLDEPQVELDDLGGDERHQRERAAVGADVVEGDRHAGPAQGVDAGEHLGGAVGQRALGELEHDVELLARPLRAARAPRRARARRAATARR